MIHQYKYVHYQHDEKTNPEMYISPNKRVENTRPKKYTSYMLYFHNVITKKIEIAVKRIELNSQPYIFFFGL